jgi:hypothetical protein
MKQLLSLFLFLLPCLAWAQYPSNGNQKITLGEQTTADGLVYRGVAATDTVRKPSIDTMAYMVLDTTTNIIWHYKKATSNAWLRLNLLPSDTASFNYVNTYGTQTVNGAKTFTSVINSNVQNASFITATGTTQFVRGQMVNTGGNFVFGIGNSTGETPFSTSPYASFFVSRSDTDIAFGTNDLIRFTLKNNGRLGIGQLTPTAVLHLKAGTATASTAPLKFTSGTNLTTAEAGAMEFNGTNLFFSPSTVRHTVNHGLTGSATLDFPSTLTLLSADLTITVTGAADGDVVSLGIPNAAVNANTSYSAWVSASNTVTVRFNNYSNGTVNPASGSFKVFVTK